MYFIMASKCNLFYFADRALLALVQGLERLFVIRLLFLSLYKDTQLSCVFEKKNTIILTQYISFRYWPNNKSRMYILETTGMSIRD